MCGCGRFVANIIASVYQPILAIKFGIPLLKLLLLITLSENQKTFFIKKI